MQAASNKLMNFVHVEWCVRFNLWTKGKSLDDFFLFIYIICPLNYCQSTYLLKTAHMTDQPPKKLFSFDFILKNVLYYIWILHKYSFEWVLTSTHLKTSTPVVCMVQRIYNGSL